MALNHEKSVPVYDLTKLKILLLAPPKFGKTTFASLMESPYFICTERGHNALSINKTDVYSWRDLRNVIGSIIKDTEGFKTFIIDTADRAFDLCCEDVIQGYNNPIAHDGTSMEKPKKLIKSISQMPYGQSAQARDQFFAMMRSLERVDAGIVFISHLVEENSKINKDTGQLTCSLPEKLRAGFYAWFDLILRIEINDVLGPDGNNMLERSIVAYTEKASATGSRYKIEQRLPLSWSALNAEIMKNKAEFEKTQAQKKPKTKPVETNIDGKTVTVAKEQPKKELPIEPKTENNIETGELK